MNNLKKGTFEQENNNNVYQLVKRYDRFVKLKFCDFNTGSFAVDYRRVYLILIK